MHDAIITDQPDTPPVTLDNARLTAAGQVANQHAAAGVFADYTSRKAENTLKRQARDLALFARFLHAVRAIEDAPDAYAVALRSTGAAWSGITWGLVEAFIKWQFQQGYAVASVNVRLSTVKTYAGLAFKAGALDKTAYLLIKGVSGYSHKEAKRVDEKRGQTRQIDTKKANAVLITDEQAKVLKAQPDDTGQGRRDALLMALLLDHGLRVSELTALTVKDFDLAAGVLTFYRAKTDTMARHELSAATVKALRTYLDAGDAPAQDEPLLRGSRKGGKLTEAGMNRFAITRRVRDLAAAEGIDALSAHDCRHYAATKYAQKPGVTTRDLMDFFGWSSPAMAARYQHAAEVSDLAVR